MSQATKWLFAIVALSVTTFVAGYAALVLGKQASPTIQRLSVRDGLETMNYAGQTTGKVVTVQSLPSTPEGLKIPIVEVEVTHEKGATLKWVGFGTSGQNLKVGDAVLVTKVHYQSVVGGTDIRFLKKIN